MIYWITPDGFVMSTYYSSTMVSITAVSTWCLYFLFETYRLITVGTLRLDDSKAINKCSQCYLVGYSLVSTVVLNATKEVIKLSFLHLLVAFLLLLSILGLCRRESKLYCYDYRRYTPGCSWNGKEKNTVYCSKFSQGSRAIFYSNGLFLWPFEFLRFGEINWFCLFDFFPDRLVSDFFIRILPNHGYQALVGFNFQ